MRLTTLLLLVLWFNGFSFGQSDLKEIILNKEGIVDENWVEKIQNGGWEYIKTVGVKGKKISSVVSIPVGKTWNFSKTSVKILPYMWKSSEGEYSDLDAKFHSSNRVIVIETVVDLGKGRISNSKAAYEVINLTNEYLVLEEIDDKYCFDFGNGRRMTKDECNDKRENEPERLFGGRSINIGGKPPKKRLVFKKMN